MRVTNLFYEHKIDALFYGIIYGDKKEISYPDIAIHKNHIRIFNRKDYYNTWCGVSLEKSFIEYMFYEPKCNFLYDWRQL